jgi:hypothetical protein
LSKLARVKTYIDYNYFFPSIYVWNVINSNPVFMEKLAQQVKLQFGGMVVNAVMIVESLQLVVHAYFGLADIKIGTHHFVAGTVSV